MKPLPSPWQELPKQPHDRPPLGHVLAQGAAFGLVGALLLALFGVLGLLGIYAYYGADLPSPDELYARGATFKSTKIMDRHGALLYEIMDPLGGRRTLVRYDDLPQVVIDAVVATEDASFFSNPGVNPFAIARAVYMNVREGETKGASTITQQLVKQIYLTPDKTLSRKLKEAILAAEITRRYSKQEILTLYLNESYFGNLSYGIGAAAESYFAKSVGELTLDEAALLAGMLQSPVLYDPYLYPEAAQYRRATVLGLMVRQGMITTVQRDQASAVPFSLAPREITIQAPHMVFYVREQLEQLYGPEMLYRGGLQVYTTLDLTLQHEAERIVRDEMPRLHQRQATNAAVVVIDPHSGDILALVGSADFYDSEISGQVDVTRRLRQPGSTIKPLTYLAAFERGWTPYTLLMDVPQAFPDGANPDYVPLNYDLKTVGPLSLRSALANSRNIPAVSTLYQIGMPALLEMSQRLGIRSLTRPDYGLSLTLGGGEVTLLEMTGAYATLANAGRGVTPRAILSIEDQLGQTVLAATPPVQPAVLDARHVYWLSEILSDNALRTPTFGADSALKLPFPAAAKTGTTNDYRDSWTLGYTPDVVVGVWVGNSNNTPTDRLTGSQGAAPIWQTLMVYASGGHEQQGFVRPPNMVQVEICPLSGQAHTEHCPEAITGLFLQESLPSGCSVHKLVQICQTSQKLASADCPAHGISQVLYTDHGPAWDDWARAQGLALPPRAMCDVHTAPSVVEIQAPTGAVSGVVDLTGSTLLGAFDHYLIDYGLGTSPDQWRQLGPAIMAPIDHGVLARWDTRGLDDGVYVLRLRVFDRLGQVQEARTTIQIANRQPTPQPTLQPTAALQPTPVPISPYPAPTNPAPPFFRPGPPRPPVLH